MFSQRERGGKIERLKEYVNADACYSSLLKDERSMKLVPQLIIIMMHARVQVH